MTVAKRSLNLFFFIYLFFILLLLLPVIFNLRVQFLSFGGDFSLTFFFNGLQRFFGALTLFLLFIQIVVGAYRLYISRKLGGWIMKFHIWQGRIIYLFVLIHSLSFILFNFLANKGFNPFYVFVDFCVLCPTKQELFYSFGRIAFWLLNVTIIAALLKGEPWWQQNWRYFHLLNYPLFFLVSSHAFFVGSDFSLKTGILGKLNLMMAIAVFLTILQKISTWFKRSFKWN